MIRKQSRDTSRLTFGSSVIDALIASGGSSGTCSEANPMGRGLWQSEISNSSGYAQTEWERSVELAATIQRTNEALGAVFLGPFSEAFNFAGAKALVKSGNYTLRFFGLALALYEDTHGQVEELEFGSYPNSPPSSFSPLGDYGDLAMDLAITREFMEYGRRERERDPDCWQAVDEAAERQDHNRNIGRSEIRNA